MINGDISDDMSYISKGKYEMFEVGDELVLSDSREKIIEYARDQGKEEIKYRYSVDNKEGLKIDKEI